MPNEKSSGGAAAHFYYTAAAALMIAFAFAGFGPYYLHGTAFPGREVAPPMKTVVAVHAAAMTAWLVLSLVQPWLIAKGGKRAHMKVGKVGAALAALVFAFGLRVAVQSVRNTPPEALIWGLSPRQFMAVPFLSTVLFAAFVAAGIRFRFRPDLHRPMMLLASLSAISAAVSRIDPLNALYHGTVAERWFGPFFLTLVVAVLLFAVRCALTRTFERPFAVGLGVLVAANAAVLRLAPTAAWADFAAWATTG